MWKPNKPWIWRHNLHVSPDYFIQCPSSEFWLLWNKTTGTRRKVRRSNISLYFDQRILPDDSSVNLYMLDHCLCTGTTAKKLSTHTLMLDFKNHWSLHSCGVNTFYYSHAIYEGFITDGLGSFLKDICYI